MLPLKVGGIYLVAEPALRLLPENERTMHVERRRFVILSGETTNVRASWKTVLGCPISGSTSLRTEFDVKLADGESGTTKKCWIRVPAVQPLMKADLQDLTGVLSEERLEELRARVFDYMGLV